MEVKRICVLGAGTMGNGIAQICAQTGYEVSMMDIEDRFVQAGLSAVKKNLQKFQVPNVELVQTFAPDNLGGLPAPTAVFIGGSGGRMEEILDLVSHRLKPSGHIVINIVALENLSTAVNALKARGFVPDVTLVSVARSTNVMELTRFEALNPVFVVTGVPSPEKEQ